MNTRLMIPLLVVACTGVACGRDGSRRDQPEYETVDEGSAAGVTSTLHGPGESLPPITNTNADTTTSFTGIDPNAVGTAPAPLPPNAVPGAPMTTTPPQTSASPEIPPHATPKPMPKPTEPEPAESSPPPTQTAPPTQTDTNVPVEEEEPPPPPTTTETRGQ